MRLISIIIFRWQEENPAILCQEHNLDMLWFYQRGMAKEHIVFNSRMIAGRIKPGNKARVSLEDNKGYCYCWTTTDGLSATAITDTEYQEKPAFCMLNQLLMDFREYFSKNPAVYMNVSTDSNLKYENLEVFLKKW